MNKVHSKVWNKELGQLVVASEFAKSDSAGAVQGAGATRLLRRTLLSVLSASLIATLCAAGSTAFAQEWTVSDGSNAAAIGDGGTVTFQGDDNIKVALAGGDDDATLQIALDPDLVVDSVATGNTVMNDSGVAVGVDVVLGSDGLTLANGPSVTLAGINAGNRVITGVAAGTAADHAVNLGQLDAVGTVASNAQSAADAAAATANDAQVAAAAAQTTADAAGAGWTVTDGTHAANIGPGGEVAFSGDSNVTVTQSGIDDAGAVGIALNPDLEVTSVTTGGTRIDNAGLTVSGGPSVTSAGIDAGGSKITNVAAGDLTAASNDAVTGGQIFDLLIDQGAGGVRYFHARSTQPDSEAEGEESVAIGPNTVSGGDSSFAAGDGATTTATAEGAIALGQGAAAGIEGGAVADGGGSIAIGRDSQAGGNSTLALGDGARVEDERVSDAVAVGSEARISGMESSGALAAGYQAHAGAASATAVGAGAYAGGDNAAALGAHASATAGSSIAIGQASATAGSALAAGSGAYAGTTRGIALGSGAGVGTEGNAADDRTDHIAIGTNAGQGVVGNQTTAIGYSAGQGVTGDDNVAIGTEAGRSLQGNNNISIGRQANDGAGTRAQAVAIGDLTEAGSDSVALGSGAKASGSETLALGKDASAGSNGVAVGAHTTAEGSNIALGRNSSAGQSDVTGAGYLTGTAAPGSAVSVGSSAAGEAFQRRLINVADGAQRYDAVNVGQLRGAQQAVANLVGGNVTVQPNGGFGGYIIELQDTDGNLHQYGTVAEAINAVSSGDISVLPGNAVIYNPDGTITVAAGQAGDQAVNVSQLNAAIDESGVKYFSANTTEAANRNNDGATGVDAMAVGPSAVASGDSSLAIGHAARVNAGADNGVALGYDVSARAANATVLGNRSHTYDQGGVAIGQQAVSRGENSVVMGTGAEADPKAGGSVDNAIVIGTVAEATADDGIAIGQSALASEERAVAQGYDAHAMATDSQAFGTRARSTGVNSQASGTDAAASGANAIANGTDSRGHASDGIAIGTGAVSGLATTLPEEAYRNVNGIAIGNSALSDNRNALALGVEARASAQSATAIGDGAVATATAEDGLAIGSGARVTAQNASAFGPGAEAVAINALAVGSGASASAANASAFGQGAQALNAGSVALGSNAVTAAAIGTVAITVDKHTYAFAGTAPVATVSVGAVGAERTITNVAAGRIGAGSTDAINGSQLHGTNMALEALAGDLDTTGQSVADALGGASSYDPATHQVAAGLSVGGNTYTNVQDALTYVGQGWDVSAEGGATANVTPGGSVDFGNNDGNIEVTRSGTDLRFDLADDLSVGNSITVGDTFIDGDSIATNNLTVDGETRLGDNFVVNNSGDVTYNGAEIATQDDGLSFAGNTGVAISKTLGDDTPVTISGGLAAGEASTGANLRVDSDGNQLNLVMARDLTDLDSITINNGPVIDGSGIDMGGHQITGLADGTEDDDAVNLGQLKEVADAANGGWNVSVGGEGAVADNKVGPNGVVDFSNDDGNIEIDRTGTDLAFNLADDLEIGNSITVGDTTIGRNEISVGGANSITISGDTGTIGGLQNQTVDYPEFADGSGRAATEEQLNLVNQSANAGWNLSGSGTDGVNIGPNGSVDFQGDSNITVAQTGVDQDGVIEVALNRDLDVDSVTVGDTFIDATGVAIGTEVHLGNTGLVINGGPSMTVSGIDAGGLVITNVAPGEISATSQDAVNGSQLYGMGDSITSIIGGNAVLNPDGTITTSDIGGTGYDNIDDAIRSANDAANAGWTATDANGNHANIGPNGTVTFVGDDNINVNQTGTDGNAVVEVTLDRDLDVDSITAGDTVIDTDGVSVGDDVHLGDTGLVIEGGPSVTTDGIDAGGDVISNVAAGVADTDAVNVGQLNELAGSVNDNDERVTSLENGASGPFQVSQDSDFVPSAPTGGNSAAGGNGAVASGDNSTALGNQAVASGNNSTAIGQGAQATHDNSVALGQGSVTTVGAQTDYDAAYVGKSDSAGEVNVGNRTISGVAPGSAGTDAVNVNQLNAGVHQAVVTANEYTDQRFDQIQGDVWNLHGRVDELERSINSGVASAMAMRQAPYVAGATTYYAGVGAYKGEGALGVSLRRTSDNGRWSLEGGFSANHDGAGGYIGVSGVLGGN